MKSVSGADEAAYSSTAIGPVTSVSWSSGGVVYASSSVAALRNGVVVGPADLRRGRLGEERERPGRVVAVAVGRLVGGRRGGELPVAVAAIGPAAAA